MRDVRIATATTIPIALPIEAPRLHSDGLTEWTTRIVVRLETADGLVGWGEAGGRISPDRARALAGKLIGEDAFALEKLRLRLNHGKFYSQESAGFYSGAEAACLDLQGKATGRSMSDLLGGRLRDEIPLIAYLFARTETDIAPAIRSTDEIVAHTGALVERFGFRTIKYKGGVVPPEEDIAATRALREAFPRAALRLDPNGIWTTETGLSVAKALADCGLEWLEDPTAGIEGMAEVTRRGGIPTATNMCLTHAEEFPRAAAIRAVDVVLCDLWYAGGPRASQQLATMCGLYGMGVGVHSQGESGIGMATMLHFAASLPTLTHAVDAHYHHLSDDILIGGLLAINDGAMRVPDGPGLGIEVDTDRLRRYNELFQEIGRRPSLRGPDPSRPDWHPTYPSW